MPSELSDREIDVAQTRLSRLTGICPKCGDDGWWLDDEGYHDCDCGAVTKASEQH